MTAAYEKLACNDLLCRFFQSFDEKDWIAMRACLCDEVFTDYSSFRDVPAGTVSGDRYVDQRRAALAALDMQHNFLNLAVDVSGEEAEARCNYIIHRFHPSFDGMNDNFFHSYGHYIFGFRREFGGWRIAQIKQVLLRNHGNREIHGATRSENNTRHI
jgi:hypothetical protein